MLGIVVILANARNLLRDKFYVLLFLLVSFAVYFAIFYMIDEQKQNAPISSLMESSFKRGMFCFIPPLLFYIATNQVMLRLSSWLERFRTGV